MAKQPVITKLHINGQTPIVDYTVVTFASTAAWDFDIRGKLSNAADQIDLNYVEVIRSK